jgi:hypothetical protein
MIGSTGENELRIFDLNDMKCKELVQNISKAVFTIDTKATANEMCFGTSDGNVYLMS